MRRFPIRAYPAALSAGLAAMAAAALMGQSCKSLDMGDNDGAAPSGAMDTATYTCAGKTSCTEMRTCAEAKYYLNHCGAAIDGDGDGIPCEDQLCGH